MAPGNLTVNHGIITSGFLQVEPNNCSRTFDCETLATIWKACDYAGVDRTDAVGVLVKMTRNNEVTVTATNDFSYTMPVTGTNGKPKPAKGRKPFLKFIESKRRRA